MAVKRLASLVGLGVVAGVTGSITGIGGGLLVGPGLATMMPLAMAVGTAQTSVVATSAVTCTRFARNDASTTSAVMEEGDFHAEKKRMIDWNVGATLAAGGMVGARIGAGPVAKYFQGGSKSRGALLTSALYAAVCLGSIPFLLKMDQKERDQQQMQEQQQQHHWQKQQQQQQQQQQSHQEGGDTQVQWVVDVRSGAYEGRGVGPRHFFLGSFVGVVASLLGIGGTAIILPYLVLFDGMPQHRALGTCVFSMFPVALVGSFTHYGRGNVALSAVVPVVIGCTIGSLIGSAWSVHASDSDLRRVLCAGLGLLGAMALANVRNALRSMRRPPRL